MALYLSETEVERLLPMPDAIGAVEEAFVALAQKVAVNRPRQRVRMRGGVLHVMPAAWESRGYFGFKAYSSFGETRFWFWLFETKSGALVSIMSADRLGQRRTGAASGVATKYMARVDAATAGILGSGWQAESQLEAICAVRPLRDIRCYSRDRQHRDTFSERMSERLGVRVMPVAAPEDAAHGCDIVITATGTREPVLRGEWIEPGTHVNAIGANWAHKSEIDGSVVTRSAVVAVDSIEQARTEAGDLIIPAEKGIWQWENAHELGEIVSGKVAGRTAASDITLFKSCGIALEDVAVAALVYERALSQHIGTTIRV